ncbi:unnamed protein product, partial [Closterium sp. Naga37s-1]
VVDMGADPSPRYAPPDPTLPAPWRGLVDGSTGYLYYWNPDTNQTQYERPGGPAPAGGGGGAAAVNGASAKSAQQNGGHAVAGDGGAQKTAAAAAAAAAAAVGGGGGGGVQHVNGAAASSDDVVAYKRKHEITVVGSNIPPFLTFEAANFPSDIYRELKAAGFPTPTPIQAQSWPIALSGSDVVAVAKTGSGKTIGYLLPGFVHLQQRRNNSRQGPTVLVLAPTRELATQIHAEAVKFGRSSRISSTCVYGGAPKNPQLRELQYGADIVIATPGRLNDFLEANQISLRQVSYLVLDEADRMLDMGFEPQIRKIVARVPGRHQTLMYTATWPREVRRIAEDLLSSPVHVTIGSTDQLVANKSITQIIELPAPYEKQRRLEQILRSLPRGSKAIVFCSTKRMCDQLSRSLDRSFGAAAIHGDKSQPERDHTLAQFRSGAMPTLVATDVAARGLDVKDIRCVINYDFPTGVEDYVHRIGRTGRAGATGTAYTFFGPQDGKYARELIKVLEGAQQVVPPELQQMAASAGPGRGMSRWGGTVGAAAGMTTGTGIATAMPIATKAGEPAAAAAVPAVAAAAAGAGAAAGAPGEKAGRQPAAALAAAADPAPPAAAPEASPARRPAEAAAAAAARRPPVSATAAAAARAGARRPGGAEPTAGASPLVGSIAALCAVLWGRKTRSGTVEGKNEGRVLQEI